MFYNKRIFERCFNHRGRYWYKNIKEIPLYFKLIHHLVKYGYDEYAEWETFNWFIDVMKQILPKYKEGHWGIPIITYDPFDPHFDLTDEEVEELEKKNEEEWYRIIDRMVELLNLMDEKNYLNYESYEEQQESMNKAKDEFFELFSKYFYNLWN